jgi:hypothetical protein
MMQCNTCLQHVFAIAGLQRDYVEIKKACTGFIQLDVKPAKIITAEITNNLRRDRLNLEDCRGQSYDNQATTAGVHSGVQQRILDMNTLTVFILCNNHSQFGLCSCCPRERPGTYIYLVL